MDHGLTPILAIGAGPGFVEVSDRHLAATKLNHASKWEGIGMDPIFGISAFMGALLSAVMLVLAIVLPISAYAAQKWAHRCYLELEKLNRTIDEFTRYVIEQEYRDTEGGPN